MILLMLLLIKHWYVDFVLQTNEMVKGKAIYGNMDGISHSFQHALFTMLIVCVYEDPPIALIVGLFDGITHYHIDWMKMNWGCRDIADPKFWSHLGLDQLAHQLCYLIIIIALV